MKHQRLHPFITFFKEVYLEFNDFGCDFEQSVIATLQTFDKPACFLQVIFEEGVVSTAV